MKSTESKNSECKSQHEVYITQYSNAGWLMRKDAQNKLVSACPRTSERYRARRVVRERPEDADVDRM